MDDFILWLRAQGYHISLYIAGSRRYVEALLPILDPNGCIGQSLCRDDCVRCPVWKNVYLKDVNRVRNAANNSNDKVIPVNLARTILVDNNPASFTMQPQNGIVVSDWLGGAEDDAEFERVKSLLVQLERGATGYDVQSVLPKLQRLENVGNNPNVVINPQSTM